jgi:hypothetical protein
MRDAMFDEKRVQSLILASPVSLNRNDPSVKPTFYHILEFYKFLEHIRFELQQVDPNKFTEIIDEGYIVLLMTY